MNETEKSLRQFLEDEREELSFAEHEQPVGQMDIERQQRKIDKWLKHAGDDYETALQRVIDYTNARTEYTTLRRVWLALEPDCRESIWMWLDPARDKVMSYSPNAQFEE